MKYTKTLIASCLVAGSTLAVAEIEWLDRQTSDLRTEHLSGDTAAVPASIHQESAPIQFSWSRDQALAGRMPAGDPSASAAAPVAESKQYWLDVTGRDLARGVDLPLTASGAVIRISALDSGTDLQLQPEQLKLEFNGRPVQARFGPDNVSRGRDLQREGMPVPEDTLAFRLSDRIGAGNLRVAHTDLQADMPLVINVHEPESPWTAKLSLPRFNFLAGEKMDFDFNLGDGRENINVRSIQAVVASPDASQTWPITRGRGNQLQVDAAPLARMDRPAPGLYEAHVYAETRHRGQTIRRDLTLAFSIAPPIARLNEQAARGQSSGQGVELILGVETAVAGRYQVNAEVLGTNAHGELEPFAFMQSAAELDAGEGQIELSLDPDVIRSSGLSAPFEVRNLQLLDQGRMYLLEQRAHGLRIFD